MRKIDSRTAFSYITITLIGMTLLALVSPSFGVTVPLALLLALLIIIPITAFATFTIFFTGKSTKNSKLPNRQLQKTLASIAGLGMALNLLVTNIASQQALEQGTRRFVYENTAVGILFAAFMATLLLINIQKFVYWPFWGTQDKNNSDERQKTVRNRVYEKSYRVLIFALITGAIITQTDYSRLDDAVYQTLALAIFGMPSIIAAWQKDS